VQGKHNALHEAAANGHSDTVAAILQSGRLDINSCSKVGANSGSDCCIYYSISPRVLLYYICTSSFQGGSTALHLAALNGHLSVVNRLLEQPGVDACAKDEVRKKTSV
jgi:ankyrin repeat protein